MAYIRDEDGQEDSRQKMLYQANQDVNGNLL